VCVYGVTTEHCLMVSVAFQGRRTNHGTSVDSHDTLWFPYFRVWRQATSAEHSRLCSAHWADQLIFFIL